jgi:hypothetical protein
LDQLPSYHIGKLCAIVWVTSFILLVVSSVSFGQDKKAVDNKRQIREIKQKSVKKKEKPVTKDIAGKRIRTKNANSTAGRAVYANPSPYADKKRTGKDRVAKPIGGGPVRIRSRSAEVARNNVYPGRGPLSGTRKSETGKTNKSKYTRLSRLSVKPSSSGGKFRVSQPRSLSRSAESARSNVYPQKGPFVNRSSKPTENVISKTPYQRKKRLSSSARIAKTYSPIPKSRTTSAEARGGRTTMQRYTRQAKMSTSSFIQKVSVSAPRSRSSSAETTKGKLFQQKGPFVNRASKDPQQVAAGKKRYTRKGTLSTGSARITKTFAGTPRSQSTSAETSKKKFFQQGGAFVNRQSKQTENVYKGGRGTTRIAKLSAGPQPPGKKKRVTPRSASQGFVTKGKKNVYWGKFSKGEKPFTTDLSGNPVRRRNYSTPPNEIVKAKNPYEGRKKSAGDQAYSGPFKSGHKSVSKKTEKAWKGDLTGQPLRKRPQKAGEVAGERIWSPNLASGFSLRLMRMGWGRAKGIKPVKGGGSISARAGYRSNAPLPGKQPGIGGSALLKGQNRITGIKPLKGSGGSISAKGAYRSNAPVVGKQPGMGASVLLKGQNRITGIKPKKGGGSISAAGWYRSNQPIPGKQPGEGASAILKNQSRTTGIKPKKGGGSISAAGWYRSNQPIPGKQPGIGATSIMKYQGRMTGIKPKPGAGESISGRLWNNNERSIQGKVPGIGATALQKYESKLRSTYSAKFFSQGGLHYYKGSGSERARAGNMSASDKSWNNNNRALPAPNYGKAAGKVAVFAGNQKTKEPKKGGGSVSGKLWNNKGQPIEVRAPKGAYADDVNYSGNMKQAGYEQNPNAAKLALKKQKPSKTVFIANKLQTPVKAKDTDTKPNAAKGSLPGVGPTKATVKASEYANSLKVYWSYKHNPGSAKLAQKTIAPSRHFVRASDYEGKMRLSKNYRHNPNSHKEALKVIAPGRAYARITDYQGNIKMRKYNPREHFPDARFAHLKENNVKQERTITTNIKLLWSKLFKKNETQPDAVKNKSLRPRYDKREKEVWKALYD